MHFKIFTILKKRDTNRQKRLFNWIFTILSTFFMYYKRPHEIRLIPVSLWMRVVLSALVFIWCSRNSSSLIFVLFFSFFYSAQIYLNGTSSAYKLSPSSRILLLFLFFSVQVCWLRLLKLITYLFVLNKNHSFPL